MLECLYVSAQVAGEKNTVTLCTCICIIIHRVLLKAVDEPLHALIEHSALHDLANSCATQLRNTNTLPLHFFHSFILVLTPLLTVIGRTIVGELCTMLINV